MRWIAPPERDVASKTLQSKVAAVFEHVYESYQGEGISVYTNVA